MKRFLLKILIFSLPIPFLAYGSFLAKFAEFWDMDRALQEHPRVILLGSSVNRYTAGSDTDMRSISDMVDAVIGPKAVGISHGAYHADIYLELCRNIVKRRQKPRIVITEINLRTFSPEWDRRPQYQFVKERTLLHGFPFFDPAIYAIDDATFQKTPVFQYDKPVGVVKDFLHLESESAFDAAKGGFIFHYSYVLDPGHRKLTSLKNISNILKDNGVIPLFYITPIDDAKAEDILGKEFTENIQRNAKTITDALSSTGATTLDLSLSLDSSYFDYIKVPNEHLNQRGREFVALSLASSVNALLR